MRSAQFFKKQAVHPRNGNAFVHTNGVAYCHEAIANARRSVFAFMAKSCAKKNAFPKECAFIVKLRMITEFELDNCSPVYPCQLP